MPSSTLLGNWHNSIDFESLKLASPNKSFLFSLSQTAQSLSYKTIRCYFLFQQAPSLKYTFYSAADSDACVLETSWLR